LDIKEAENKKQLPPNLNNILGNLNYDSDINEIDYALISNNLETLLAKNNRDLSNEEIKNNLELQIKSDSDLEIKTKQAEIITNHVMD